MKKNIHTFSIQQVLKLVFLILIIFGINNQVARAENILFFEYQGSVILCFPTEAYDVWECHVYTSEIVVYGTTPVPDPDPFKVTSDADFPFTPVFPDAGTDNSQNNGGSGGTGGSDDNTQIVLDCNGVVNGTAVINTCGECVGGNTGKEDCSPDPCIPLTFNYSMPVSPIPSSSIYNGYGWCGFLTLATIKGGTPCSYATAYYAQYKKSENINGCNSTLGITPSDLIRFYTSQGITFHSPVWNKCTIVSGMFPNKGLIVTPVGHVYLIYGLHRSNGGEIMMDKYDTRDQRGWNLPKIPLLIESSNLLISK